MRAAGLAMLAAILGAGGAQAQAAPEGLVWMALNDINAPYFDADDPSNRPALTTQVPADMIRPVDLNGDGRADWLVDYQAAEAAAFCGTGGCLQKLYVATEDGLMRALEQQALQLEIVERGGERRLDLWVHHTYCAMDVTECWRSFAWDDQAGRLVERVSRDGGARITVGDFVIIEDAETSGPPPGAPQPVAAQWFETRRTCPSSADDGFEIRRAQITAVPDLDGDGRGDWVAAPPLECPDRPGDPMASPGFTVWRDLGEGEAVQVFASAPEQSAALELTTQPATLIVEDYCDQAQCPDWRLRWDSAAGRLRAE